jgi:hypothetical protein
MRFPPLRLIDASDGPYRLENSLAHFGAGYMIREWRLSSWSDRLQGFAKRPEGKGRESAITGLRRGRHLSKLLALRDA